MNRTIITWIAICLLTLTLALPTTTLAGGWSVTTLDSLPTDMQVGVPFTIGFTVRQHGNKPMSGLSPTIRMRNASSGETVQFSATAEGAVGHYVATLIIPSAGTWEWEIDAFGAPAPMSPLTIAVAASITQPAPTALPITPFAGVMLVILVLATGLMVLRLRRRANAPA
jgi:hypothetical protein